jgi:hypothetical protein
MEENTWYRDTTRLEKSGFQQEMIIDEKSTPEQLAAYNARIAELREKKIPFETVGIYPRAETAHALYVKGTVKK